MEWVKINTVELGRIDMKDRAAVLNTLRKLHRDGRREWAKYLTLKLEIREDTPEFLTSLVATLQSKGYVEEDIRCVMSCRKGVTTYGTYQQLREICESVEKVTPFDHEAKEGLMWGLTVVGRNWWASYHQYVWDFYTQPRIPPNVSYTLKTENVFSNFFIGSHEEEVLDRDIMKYMEENNLTLKSQMNTLLEKEK